MRVTAILFLIILLPSALGYGLASSYLEDDTMVLLPGEIREYQVELQNNDKTEVEFSFVLDSEIVTIKNPQETYLVGGDNPIKKLTLIVEVPENAPPGEEYIVSYSATPLKFSDKTISLNIEFNDQFTVLVKESEISSPIENKTIEYSILIVILIIFLVSLILVFRKNNLLSQRFLKK